MHTQLASWVQIYNEPQLPLMIHLLVLQPQHHHHYTKVIINTVISIACSYIQCKNKSLFYQSVFLYNSISIQPSCVYSNAWLAAWLLYGYYIQCCDCYNSINCTCLPFSCNQQLLAVHTFQPQMVIFLEIPIPSVTQTYSQRIPLF